MTGLNFLAGEIDTQKHIRVHVYVNYYSSAFCYMHKPIQWGKNKKMIFLVFVSIQ